MRLIKLSEVINEIERFKGYLDEDMIERIKIAMNRLPTIDAVQVVRCKDCKHFDGSYPMCCRFEETFEPDGYCSFGEKREVEG